ncbi:MAG: ABC transporter ATP-binding protein, partial [Planctomycetes bacterium]|nr:ABC transporter ATP-binding protein [Planctomycetota bacterium]
MSDLAVHQLSKAFPTAAGTLEVLRGVELEMQRGEALVVTGPSGSGKSTLLYIVGTLEEPTSGEVRIMGEDPFRRSQSAMARYRNEHIGFVFQEHHLLPQCTVLENVLLPALAGRGADKAAEARARELLSRVGLGERLDHRPAQLSGGERQRAAVCRALINQPAVLLADEPTGSLDRSTAESVGDLLLEIAREEHALLICVTHSGELAARFPRRL